MYECVAREAGASTQEIARRLGIAESQAEAELTQLRRMGLVYHDEAQRVRPTPDGPELVFERLRARIDGEYNRQRGQALELRTLLSRVLGEAVLDNSGRASALHPLGNETAVELCLLEFAGHARAAVYSMWSEDPVSRTRFHGVVGSVAAQQELDIRFIYPSAGIPEHAEARHPAATIRSVAQPPVTLHLFDSRAAVVAVRGSTRGVAVREPALVRALDALFTVTWTHGRPLPESTSPHRPDRDDIVLLQLLGEGAKDEQVARTLGLSVRTVRRRISLLLDSLNATSRFQAGVLARGRGWV